MSLWVARILFRNTTDKVPNNETYGKLCFAICFVCNYMEISMYLAMKHMATGTWKFPCTLRYVSSQGTWKLPCHMFHCKVPGNFHVPCHMFYRKVHGNFHVPCRMFHRKGHGNFHVPCHMFHCKVHGNFHVPCQGKCFVARYMEISMHLAKSLHVR